ncbi:hypothetical protein L226DRAFT_574770 [Lentinus tigrinus ALCF2SS1-7]|uniref:DUF6534 domain-containing protein n=1 Tax=Lentinus tigrinus ALCF2SS1-6 TaxID=1328759 RepID=A0A5C2S3B1_9APHY|nr:hypothetical protein L227DRAFT_613339 [Lentinus tigrinus ALCF2SS1-6]RPD70448.1 hypothetical protein L226DRAFT_574770 [Lentinus tigrinus ALCF2SS1-7]
MLVFPDPVLSQSASLRAKSLGLPSLDSSYGAYLLGAFAGLVSYGILVNQAYRYARVYNGDPKESVINQAFVIAALTMDTLGTAVNLHTCYTYLVSNYFQPLVLLRGIWSLKIQPVMAGMTVLVCQAFKYETFAEYQRFYWMDSAACGCAIMSDCLTAGSLIVILRTRHQQTAYKKTKMMLNALMVYTINTGLLTGLVNGMALIFALVQPNTMIWISIEFIGVRLYTNSVLAVLNSRKSLRETADRSGPQDLELELQSTPQTDGSSQDRSGVGGSETPPDAQKSTLGVVGWPWDAVIQIAKRQG